MLGNEEFKNKYLGVFSMSSEYEKAQLLWLWYDYHTEIFDASLWSAKPSMSDETMTVLVSHSAISESYKNARRARDFIYEAARKKNIAISTMQTAKNDNYRSSHKMKDRLDIYLGLSEIGKFNFIEE